MDSRTAHSMALDSRSVETVSETPLYTVVIPTLGNHDVLWKGLACLTSLPSSETEILVVFNGLPQDREGFERDSGEKFPSVRLVCTPEPYGISRAYNLGARHGSGRYVAFLHDDVLLHDVRWLEVLSGILDRNPSVGMVGGSEPKNIDRLFHERMEIEPGVQECDWSPTVSVVRKADAALHPFDEFYLVGLEDKDWGLSFRRRGLKVVCRVVDHEHVGTKGSYSLLLRERRLLDYYSKEGVRERYFLKKTRTFYLRRISRKAGRSGVDGTVIGGKPGG
jgi:glycosyltransferase involved in cell wall biosynthesis